MSTCNAINCSGTGTGIEDGFCLPCNLELAKDQMGEPSTWKGYHHPPPHTTMTTAATTAPRYVKLIRKDRTHNGLVFKEGFNCLKETEIFDERPECGPGGLYFCKEEDFKYWVDLYGVDLGFVATVTLPFPTYFR